jgi:replicative DNA helicase
MAALTTLTRRAEQALLGAMLTDPELVPAVGGTVRASDFESRRHVRLYGALRALAGQDGGGTAWAERAQKAAAGEEIPVWYLGVLADACPDPSHGTSYARLVLQASARRRLYYEAKAVARVGNESGFDARRLEQADGTGGRRLGELARQAEAVAAQMRAYARAFNPDEATGIPAPRRTPGPDAQGEELILAALIRQNPGTRHLTAALDEDAFTSDARREIFAAIQKLDVNDRDIDPLTVDWEAARRHGTGLVSAEPARTGRDNVLGYVPRIAVLHVDTTAVLNAARPLKERTERARASRNAGHPLNGVGQRGRSDLRLAPQPPATDGPGHLPRM